MHRGDVPWREVMHGVHGADVAWGRKWCRGDVAQGEMVHRGYFTSAKWVHFASARINHEIF